ncbi:phage terminase large subunit family protein, partial [Pseudomonas sp. AL15]|uniref:phage terminase large subunit family protein n=1 Tax=Pseudomonas sp. AL15 TaxID=3042236 RepID=UPI00249B8DBF
PHCSSLISEESKEWMNDRGVFVAPGQSLVGFTDDGAQIEQGGDTVTVAFGLYLAPLDCDSSASFWVSGLCSPWQTFGQRARKYVVAM